MPKITNMLTCVFLSPSVYYIPSFSNIFYKDHMNSVALNSGSKNQGIVYSSDFSSSSCY